jgi:hypothetical protein
MANPMIKSLAIIALAGPLAACAVQAQPHALGGPQPAAPAVSEIEEARYGRSIEGRTVIAESRYGHGTVSGPVRRNAKGRLEVRAPGGTWFECVRSCTETLRRETVDFWESRSNRPDVVDGPAYLRWSW